jgi:hypothetical protein
VTAARAGQWRVLCACRLLFPLFSDVRCYSRRQRARSCAAWSCTGGGDVRCCVGARALRATACCGVVRRACDAVRVNCVVFNRCGDAERLRITPACLAGVRPRNPSIVWFVTLPLAVDAVVAVRCVCVCPWFLLDALYVLWLAWQHVAACCCGVPHRGFGGGGGWPLLCVVALVLAAAALPSHVRLRWCCLRHCSCVVRWLDAWFVAADCMC